MGVLKPPPKYEQLFKFPVEIVAAEIKTSTDAAATRYVLRGRKDFSSGNELGREEGVQRQGVPADHHVSEHEWSTDTLNDPYHL
jgi:hypothetical protein